MLRWALQKNLVYLDLVWIGKRVARSSFDYYHWFDQDWFTFSNDRKRLVFFGRS